MVLLLSVGRALPSDVRHTVDSEITRGIHVNAPSLDALFEIVLTG